MKLAGSDLPLSSPVPLRLKRPGYPGSGWRLVTLLVALLVILPLGVVLVPAFTFSAEGWLHLKSNLLPEYVLNSGLLSLLVLVAVFITGCFLAFVVVFFEFPGRSFFYWALILPLSIPAYLMAFSYAEFAGYSGWLSRYLHLQIDLLNLPGAAAIFSFSLYPYLYLPLRVAFSTSGVRLMEASRSLGAGAFRSFFRVLLPVSRPAVAGGLFLVLMEVLNDYGVVKYFGIPTFTTGIFREWFSNGNMSGALRLASILLLAVVTCSGLEKLMRRSRLYSSSYTRESMPRKVPLIWGLILTGLCSAVLLLAFVIPVSQMVAGVFATWAKVFAASFFEVIANTFYLASAGAFIVVFLSVLLEYTGQLAAGSRVIRTAIFLAGFGYAIPGAVIAIGMLYPATGFDRFLYGFTGFPVLTSGIGLLISALVIRFLAVGLQPVHTGFNSMSRNISEASRSLGSSPLRSLFRVGLPLSQNYLLAAFILVFIDILKELPLTLILRPFNFDTLATRAFSLASDELLRESGTPALLIVLSGLLALFALNKLMKQ